MHGERATLFATDPPEGPIFITLRGIARGSFIPQALPHTADVSVRRFLRTYLDEKLANLRKADLRSRLKLAVDFARNCAIEQAESFGWARRVLILEGDSDRMVRAADREELALCQSDTEIQIIDGTKISFSRTPQHVVRFLHQQAWQAPGLAG